MRRILLSWHGVDIYSYPAMLYLGLLAGIFVGAYVAQLSGLNPDSFAIAVAILFIPALIGSRLFFALAHWDVFRGDPTRIWRRGESGMAMYGGLILGVPVSIPLLGALSLPFGQFWDAATFTILVAMVFTRVGCLLNGCCSGRPTDGWFGIDLPDHHGVWRRRIPTQLLEMAWAAILLVTAAMLRGRAPFPGSIFCLAIIGYGAGRIALETLREGHGDGREKAVIDATSVLLVIAALIGIFVSWSR
jgi:phosphatidylglycerol:prolipoprotein diacylglycerol transferase